MDDGVRIFGFAAGSGSRDSDTTPDGRATKQVEPGPRDHGDAAGGQGDVPLPDEPEVLRQQGREEFRGELFTDLDRLAFALELEAAEAVDAGEEDRAVRLEDQRLGVRLAQRLVSGVHAHEIQPRLERGARAYADRTR